MRKSMVGKNNSNWKGGKYKSAGGYQYIWNPNHPYCTHDGYVLEHRLVMEQYLDRYLDKKEKVHHKNGIKDDNRIENLELMESQSDHIKKCHGKKDKDYICKLCGSDTTYKDKRGYQFWSNYEDGHICSKCAYKLFQPTRKYRKRSLLLGTIKS